MEDTNKKKGISFYLAIAFIVGYILGCVLVAGYYRSSPIEPVTIYEEKEQPMLLLEFIEWGSLEDDPSTSILSYFIYNFGNVEAKNVKIKCEVRNFYTEELIKEEIFNVGNIASNGYELMDSYMDYTIDYNLDNVGGNCYIESADGEHINLYERLDDVDN